MEKWKMWCIFFEILPTEYDTNYWRCVIQQCNISSKYILSRYIEAIKPDVIVKARVFEDQKLIVYVNEASFTYKKMIMCLDIKFNQIKLNSYHWIC